MFIATTYSSCISIIMLIPKCMAYIDESGPTFPNPLPTPKGPVLTPTHISSLLGLSEGQLADFAALFGCDYTQSSTTRVEILTHLQLNPSDLVQVSQWVASHSPPCGGGAKEHPNIKKFLDSDPDLKEAWSFAVSQYLMKKAEVKAAPGESEEVLAVLAWAMKEKKIGHEVVKLFREVREPPYIYIYQVYTLVMGEGVLP